MDVTFVINTKDRYTCRSATIMICFFVIIELRWWWRCCHRITNYITQFLLRSDDSEDELQYEIKISEKKQDGQVIEGLIWKNISKIVTVKNFL